MSERILSTAELLAGGATTHEIRRMVAQGTLTRVRHGSYSQSPFSSDARERQLMLLAAVIPHLRDETVISHHTAAALHALPLPRELPHTVTAMRPGRGGGHRGATLHVRRGPLDEADIVKIGDLRVTSLARTAFDMVREMGLDIGVGVVDAAERRGVRAADWERVCESARRWPGAAQARRAVEFRAGASESPGESLSRLRFRQLGLPDPRLQFVVRARGVYLGRTDFAWPHLRLLGEFDGRVKYGRTLSQGREPGDVVHYEKRREERICQQGWWFVRFIWSDLYNQSGMLRLWEDALAVSARLR